MLVFPINLDEFDHDLTVMSLEWELGGIIPIGLISAIFVASEISFSQINVGVLNIHPLPFETSPFETGFFLGDLDMWEHLGDILVP